MIDYCVQPYNDYCREVHCTSLKNSFGEENVSYYSQHSKIHQCKTTSGHFVVTTNRHNVTEFLLTSTTDFKFTESKTT